MIVSLNRIWQARYLKRSHKFCRKLPKTLEESLAMDTKNCSISGMVAIAKDIDDFKVAFKNIQNETMFLWVTSL